MSKVLISILSDHIIPNYLYYKETEGEYDSLIFITTEYAKQKEIGNNFEKAIGFPENSIKRIKISNENYAQIIEELELEQFDKNIEYCINQTGGTKAMSIALFQFFKKFKTQFIYIPIGNNEYFDFNNKNSHTINYRLTLKEYLLLYGMTFDFDNNLLQDKEFTYSIFDKLKRNGFYLKSIPNIFQAHTLPTPNEKRYWSGSWFEEYAFNRIKEEYKLSDNEICMSVKIFRKNSQINNDNEIDIAFIKDNMLNVVECKVTMFGNSNPKDNVEKYLYKLAAISKDLGLRVNSYLFTLHKMNKFTEQALANIDKRRQILGINGIYDGKVLLKHKLNLKI